MSINVTTKLGLVTDPEEGVTCLKCTGRTSHAILAAVDVNGSDDNPEYSIDWHNGHQIIQCLGCKTVSYRVVSSNSEDYFQDERGNTGYFETEELYPPRIKGTKGLSDEALHLPQKVRQIYKETVTALSVDSPVLAAIGLRALVETVCKEKAATGKDLLSKIGSLADQRILTPANADILHKIRTMGNEAAHEVTPHNERQLSLALVIVEHLLRDVFILPKQVEAVFKKGS